MNEWGFKFFRASKLAVIEGALFPRQREAVVNALYNSQFGSSKKFEPSFTCTGYPKVWIPYDTLHKKLASVLLIWIFWKLARILKHMDTMGAQNILSDIFSSALWAASWGAESSYFEFIDTFFPLSSRHSNRPLESADKASWLVVQHNTGGNSVLYIPGGATVKFIPGV